MRNLASDLRYAVRVLRKAPGFTVVAILTLTLGIGANTSLFSIVNSVLLNPLPFPHSEQLVAIYGTTALSSRAGITYLNFLDWQHDNTTFSAMAAYRNDDFDLTGQGAAERVPACMVSAEYFEVLGTRMALGRNFTHEEDRAGGTPVVVISAGFWSRKFASSRNDKEYTIIGVLPPDFSFRRNNELYVPLGQWTDPTFLNRGISMSSAAFGRLKPGVTLAQGKQDTGAIAAHLAELFPTTNRGKGVSLYPLKQEIIGNVADFLYVLLGAVGFVLLIACANVANLLLARSLGRSREFAVRVALGATRGRVVSQILTESVLMGLVGGGLGLLLAAYATRAVLSALPTVLPRSAEIGVDWRVLLFTLFVSVMAGLAFGLAPVLRMSRPDVYEVLKKGGRGSSGARQGAQGVFVVAEMAIAIVLLIGAGLMVRSLAALWSVDPGFDQHNLLSFSVALQPSLTTNPAGIRSTMRELGQKLTELPGIESAASVGTGLPLSGDRSTLPLWVEGRPKPATKAEMGHAVFYLVDYDYAKTLHVPVQRGRFFDAHDDDKAPAVVVVDENFARSYFPNEEPIGKFLNIEEIGIRAQIIGITSHVKHWSLDGDAQSPIREELYVPMQQIPEKLLPIIVRSVGYIARTRTAPATMAGPVRQMISQMNSQQVAYGFETMDEIISDSLAARRFSMFLLGGFAAVALILASIGIYGVVSYLVGQRMHELGVRVALGAQRRDVMQLVLGTGLKMALLGVTIGLSAALGLTRLMAKLLYGVSATDPATFVAVAVVLTLVALTACYMPARRAMRVDPMIALRYE
jgi:predicted permease